VVKLLSELASQDIDSIIDYTVQNLGYKAMIKHHQSLENCFETLTENPLKGLATDFIREKYYRFSYQSHVVFYQILGSKLLIVRILHKSMGVGRWFD
jgi:toxin ParE1/3/4